MEAQSNSKMGLDDRPNYHSKRVMFRLDQVTAVMESMAGKTMIDMENGITMTIDMDYDDFMLKYGGLLIGKKKIEIEETIDEHRL